MPDTDTVSRQKWLDKLKQTRTTALRLFTKTENKLKALLTQQESVSFIMHQQSELQSLYDDAKEAHDEYTAEANFSAEEADLANTWISSLSERLTKMESDVTAYLNSHSGDSKKSSGETKSTKASMAPSAKECKTLLEKHLADLQQAMAAREAKMKEEWEDLQAEGALVAKRLKEQLKLVAPDEDIEEEDFATKLFATSIGTQAQTPLKRSSGVPDLSRERLGDFENFLKQPTAKT